MPEHRYNSRELATPQMLGVAVWATT